MNAKIMIKWSTNPDILLNPDKAFTQAQRIEMAPAYQVTGTGFNARATEIHECDCKYCERHGGDELDGYFRTREDMEKEWGEYDDVEILGEAYYVALIRQSSVDFGLFQGVK